jgi:hypothetical protein
MHSPGGVMRECNTSAATAYPVVAVAAVADYVDRVLVVGRVALSASSSGNIVVADGDACWMLRASSSGARLWSGRAARRRARGCVAASLAFGLGAAVLGGCEFVTRSGVCPLRRIRACWLPVTSASLSLSRSRTAS